MLFVAVMVCSANVWAEGLPEGMADDPAYNDFVAVPNPGGDQATQECRISRRSMSQDPVVYGRGRSVPRVLSTGSGACARASVRDCLRRRTRYVPVVFELSAIQFPFYGRKSLWS